MKHRIVVNIILFLAAAAVVAPYVEASAQTAPAAQSKVWSEPAALTSQLAGESSFAGWSIRPPAGYKAIKRPSPDGMGDVYSWVGPKRDKQVGANLSVIVATPPKGQEHAFTPDQLLANLLLSLHVERVNWKQTPTEQGAINGQPFEHVTWSATDSSKGTISHGFDYATQLANGQFILITSEDVEPYFSQTLPLTDAAALTFKVK